MRLRILQEIFGTEIPDPRDIAIISLANACAIFPRTLPTDDYEEVRARIELISRLELVSRSVVASIRELTLAESFARRQGIRREGGGWPRASGHLPFIGHMWQFRNTINGFLVEQCRKLGPVFEISIPGNRLVVSVAIRRSGKTAIVSTVYPGSTPRSAREIQKGMLPRP